MTMVDGGEDDEDDDDDGGGEDGGEDDDAGQFPCRHQDFTERQSFPPLRDITLTLTARCLYLIIKFG